MREAVSSLGLDEVLVVPGGRSRRLVASIDRSTRGARQGRRRRPLPRKLRARGNGPPAVCVVANLLLAVDDPGLGVSRAEQGRIDQLRTQLFGHARATYRRFARSQLDRRARVVVTISRRSPTRSRLPQGSADVGSSVRPSTWRRCCVTARPPENAPAQYFLAVGRPWGYREYPLALEALAVSALPHTLVVVGEAPGEERAPLERQARELGLDGRIRFAGLVSDPSRLRGWYEGAAALVATSRIEAFGYPLGEAMALGTPVVAVRRTASRRSSAMPASWSIRRRMRSPRRLETSSGRRSDSGSPSAAAPARGRTAGMNARLSLCRFAGKLRSEGRKTVAGKVLTLGSRGKAELRWVR